MAAFAFASVAGMRIAFDRARGRLAFSAAFGVAGRSLSIAGNDLLVADGGLRGRPDGIGADAASGAGNSVLADGGTAFSDAPDTEIALLGGGPGEDSVSIVQGGAHLLA
ncbi:MAG: hypothetical protein IRZ13_07365, partial [Acetobacteraceae bacterium]|nr:hypothetical protein [Acetobacteraceae bacterium]